MSEEINTNKSDLSEENNVENLFNSKAFNKIDSNLQEVRNIKCTNLSKVTTRTPRTDLFGNIISKNTKKFKVSFADQLERGRLVEIIYINDKKSADYEIRTTHSLGNGISPKTKINPIVIKGISNSAVPKYNIKRPKKKKIISVQEFDMIENDKARSICCSIF